jgi:hypothetical protein
MTKEIEEIKALSNEDYKQWVLKESHNDGYEWTGEGEPDLPRRTIKTEFQNGTEVNEVIECLWKKK